jgi:hypothetical protein
VIVCKAYEFKGIGTRRVVCVCVFVCVCGPVQGGRHAREWWMGWVSAVGIIVWKAYEFKGIGTRRVVVCVSGPVHGGKHAREWWMGWVSAVGMMCGPTSFTLHSEPKHFPIDNSVCNTPQTSPLVLASL